jgi:DNA-binding transcriptional ArsR family regulator
MADLEIIAPEKVLEIEFSLEPAYIAVADICLLNQTLSGFSEWIHQTAGELSPEQMRANSIVCGAAIMFLEGREWPSFEVWMDHVKQLDPYAMRDREMDYFLEKAAKVLSDEGEAIPSAEQVLGDQVLFNSLVERLYQHKGIECDERECEMDFGLLNDPPARKEFILAHLQEMWENYIEREWTQILPMLRESVEAFNSLDFSGKSTREIVLQIIDRDSLPEIWESLMEEIEEIIFIPSAHIGPFLLTIHVGEKTARIIFGARIPKGATISSPALQRSELLMRLNTLADETRLHILELMTQEDELGAKDIMTRLDLSQSAASRHLRQLSVTGYLIEGRRDGSKYYRLNQDRVQDTTDAIEAFLK